jgi:hypothetical protein
LREGYILVIGNTSVDITEGVNYINTLIVGKAIAVMEAFAS